MKTTLLATLAAVVCFGGATTNAKADSFGISVSYRSKPVVVQVGYGHGHIRTKAIGCHVPRHVHKGRHHWQHHKWGHHHHWGHKKRFGHRHHRRHGR